MPSASMTKYAGQLVDIIVCSDVKQATKFLSPTMVIKATRHGKIHKGVKTVQMMVTIGAPNYADRQRVKLFKKAGEPFPVKKIQFKFPPAKRTKRAAK